MQRGLKVGQCLKGRPRALAPAYNELKDTKEVARKQTLIVAELCDIAVIYYVTKKSAC